MLCGYEESEGCFALPRSLSSHNIEGGNKTMALNQLASYNCWRCSWAYEDASSIHTPYLNVHISVQSCVIFTLRVGWGWGARFEPYLKLKVLQSAFIGKVTDLVQALHGGPGRVLDAVAQGGGVVPGGDAANTDQGHQCQGHPELLS